VTLAYILYFTGLVFNNTCEYFSVCLLYFINSCVPVKRLNIYPLLQKSWKYSVREQDYNIRNRLTIITVLRLYSSGMCRRMVWWPSTNVSEEFEVPSSKSDFLLD
jgi:hypothetical protein